MQSVAATKDITRRNDYENLQFWGADHSLQILSHAQLSWSALSRIHSLSGKPIADLGACYSTLAVEGCLREIRVIPVDLMFPTLKRDYVRQIQNSLAALKPLYTGTEPGPAGFELPNELHVRPPDWENLLVTKAQQVTARYVAEDIAQLPFPDRHFSVTLAHHSVPKRATNFEAFLTAQLPEILRITDHSAHIYPLENVQIIQEGRFVHIPVTPFEDRIRAIADELGFLYERRSGRIAMRESGRWNTNELRDNLLGVFTRT